MGYGSIFRRMLVWLLIIPMSRNGSNSLTPENSNIDTQRDLTLIDVRGDDERAIAVIQGSKVKRIRSW